MLSRVLLTIRLAQQICLHLLLRLNSPHPRPLLLEGREGNFVSGDGLWCFAVLVSENLTDLCFCLNIPNSPELFFLSTFGPQVSGIAGSCGCV
jgi:hypothetical protein